MYLIKIDIALIYRKNICVLILLYSYNYYSIFTCSKIILLKSQIGK